MPNGAPLCLLASSSILHEKKARSNYLFLWYKAMTCTSDRHRGSDWTPKAKPQTECSSPKVSFLTSLNSASVSYRLVLHPRQWDLDQRLLANRAVFRPKQALKSLGSFSVRTLLMALFKQVAGKMLVHCSWHVSSASWSFGICCKLNPCSEPSCKPCTASSPLVRFQQLVGNAVVSSSSSRPWLSCPIMNADLEALRDLMFREWGEMFPLQEEMPR